MAITGDQVRMARAALKLTAQELAAKAAVSKNTVASVEAGADAHATTLAAIERALTAAGAVFIAENGGGPGVRLAKPRGKKRRG
jgi:transcriptional regulator with XRE-family HTH domain